MTRAGCRTKRQEAAAAWALWILLCVFCLLLESNAARASAFPSIATGLLFLTGTWILLARRRRQAIPVLELHSVSASPAWLGVDAISITPAIFERELRYLQSRKYRSLFISEVHDMLTGRVPCDPGVRYVALTFDDGYADNWIAAVPLLERYGMKGTFFVSTDFVDPSPLVRPTIDDASRREFDWAGYLTWPELRAMQASGAAEIQSHGKTHARVFTGNRIRRFVSPTRPSLWLFWNRYPERKTSWWNELDNDRSLWGHPLFDLGPGLANKAFLPDDRAIRHVTAWVREQGIAFFDRHDCTKALRAEWQSFLDRNGDFSRFETNDEYAHRVEADIREARETLEQHLERPVEFLCWPENVFNAQIESIAHSVGYKATISRLHRAGNRLKEAPDRIGRSYMVGDATGSGVGFSPLAELALKLRFIDGSSLLYPPVLALDAVKKLRRHMSCRETCLPIWR